MTFKASSLVPAKAYEDIKIEAMRVKIFASRMSTSLNTTLSAQNLNGMVQTLIQQKNKLDQLKVTPGLVQYVKDQESDQNYDVITEFVTLIAFIDDVISEIKLTPTNSLINSWGSNGVVWNTFTTSQTASLKSKFDVLDSAVI